MDPAKVDRSARVLSLVAQDRQVVVFTHLRIPATVMEVQRDVNWMVRAHAPP